MRETPAVWKQSLPRRRWSIPSALPFTEHVCSKCSDVLHLAESPAHRSNLRVSSALSNIHTPSTIPKDTEAEETFDRDKLDNLSRHSGIPIQHPIRSALLFSSNLFVAIALTAFTYWFALSTRYTGLIYTPRIMPMPSNPQNAIILIQLLTSLTVIAIGECFNMVCESLRWSLAVRGTNFLSFLVLSGATGFWGLLRLILAQPRRGLFGPWRMFAIYRFTVSYVLLMVAQFIWLLDIEPRTTYEVWVSVQINLGPGLGEFCFPFEQPRPNPRIDVWNYLSSTPAQIVGIPPVICLPSLDLNCEAYLFLGSPSVWDFGDDAPSSIVIVNDLPCYVLEFQTPLSDSWSNPGTRFATFLSGVRGFDKHVYGR